MSKFLPGNVHPIERVVRVLGGIAVTALLFVGPVPGWGLLGLLGPVFIVTGGTGSCPIYTALGVSTAPGADDGHAPG